VASIPDTEADAHFRSQHTFMTNAAGELAIDFVGRYETLLSDLKHVQQRTGLPDIRLPWLQAARRRVRYRDYYTTSTRHMVAERFQKDIALFAYEFDDGATK
jgi:chondroitin 4-sulfotransferase 11